MIPAATPAAAILAAVNHSGDSDSTGSIAGNIIGACHGTAAIPDGWLDALDSGDLVAQVAADAATELLEPPWSKDSVPQEWSDRYPGW